MMNIIIAFLNKPIITQVLNIKTIHIAFWLLCIIIGLIAMGIYYINDRKVNIPKDNKFSSMIKFTLFKMCVLWCVFAVIVIISWFVSILITTAFILVLKIIIQL